MVFIFSGQGLCYHREMSLQRWPNGKADSERRNNNHWQLHRREA